MKPMTPATIMAAALPNGRIHASTYGEDDTARLVGLNGTVRGSTPASR